MGNWLTSSLKNGWAAKPLPERFYARPTLEVARDLLGKVLIVCARPGLPLDDPKAGVTAGRIIETEAYGGIDPASHCARGETARCSVMFGKPGVAYVYFIYGMYEMLNFVTEPAGSPGAVLIRALEPLAGEELMFRRRKSRRREDLTCGPGRLTVAMGIRMKHNKESLRGPSLIVVDDGYKPESISVSKRVGISAAIEEDWRFFVTGNRFVSRVRENAKSFLWK